MKNGYWWVAPGLLTSLEDPTSALSSAADQFPDEFVPMVFMTGDGHREPAFQWTGRGLWPEMFRDLVAENKVCCHVEKFQNEVTINHVPVALAKVFQNQKVFGWEPDVYKVIAAVLEAAIEMIMDLMQGRALRLSDIHFLTKEMYRVHNLGYLREEGRLAMTFWDIARAQKKDPVPGSSLRGFFDFLKHYQEAAMELRTGIHPVIGAGIQRKIEKYDDHVHLISVGDAHVKVNPLYRYIQPPVGTFGVADENSL